MSFNKDISWRKRRGANDPRQRVPDLPGRKQIAGKRIGQLVKSGVLPQPAQGRHDPFTAVPAYIYRCITCGFLAEEV